MPSTGEAVMGSTEYSATSTPQKPPAAPLVGTSSPRMRMLWAVPAVLGGVLAMLNPVVGQSTTEEAGTDSFWMFLIMSIVLILISGLMSGLTVGYMSLDPLTMHVLASAKLPNDPVARVKVAREKKQAARVKTVKKHHNLLLVTLVLANSAAAQTLPIFFDRIVPTYLAIILSVTAILFFGEIFPQAVCTGDRRLSIAAFFVPLTRFLMIIFYVAAWPVAKAIDYFLGEDRMQLFRRSELKKLVELHHVEAEDLAAAANLSSTEVKIILGTLDFRAKTAKDIMVPWDQVFKLPLDHAAESDHAVAGYLLVKRLIVVDPDDARDVSSLVMRRPVVFPPDGDMFELLRVFQAGHSHLAFITRESKELRAYFDRANGGEKSYFVNSTVNEFPDNIKIMGIVTIEDLLEEIIQEDINDEIDVVVRHVEGRTNLQRALNREIGIARAYTKFRCLAERARRRLSRRRREGQSARSDTGEADLDSPLPVEGTYLDPALSSTSEPRSGRFGFDGGAGEDESKAGGGISSSVTTGHPHQNIGINIRRATAGFAAAGARRHSQGRAVIDTPVSAPVRGARRPVVAVPPTPNTAPGTSPRQVQLEPTVPES